MRTSVKTLAAGSLAAASLLITPAAIAAESDATVTVTGGALTATASASVPLSDVTNADTAQAATGTVTVGVDDATGTGAGWNVTQMVSDFTSTDADATIGATNFSVISFGTVTAEAGVDGAGTVTVGAVGSLAAERTVLSAAAGEGEGSYTAPVNVQLTVPAYSRAGTYAATITTTATPNIVN